MTSRWLSTFTTHGPGWLTCSRAPGLLGGDLAGFPNGRRVCDDVVAIELRAIAGATYALVDKTYTPDAAASAVTDGLTPADLDVPYLTSFPYLGVPHSGYTPPSI